MSQALALNSANFVELPRNRSIIGRLSQNKFIVQAKKRVSRFKTPFKVRQRISAGLRRFKIPIITVGAQIPWALPLLGVLRTDLGSALRGSRGHQASIATQMLAPFTGITFNSAMKPSWNPMELLRGLVPNLGLLLVRRFGIFRGLNQRLGQSRIPIRLS